MIRFLQKESRLTKAIFVIIIGLACVTMVITLVPGIFTNTEDGSAVYATVRGTGLIGRFTPESTISTAQVQRLASRMLQQQKLPDFLMPYMMQRAASALVQEAILAREANKLGLQVTDAELRQQLRTGAFAEYLFPNGQYIGDDRYADFVSSQFNMSVADFESELKKEMEIQRLQETVTAPITVSASDVRRQIAEDSTKVKFNYAFISADSIKNTINPTDAELQAYFQQNQARFAKAVPEARNIEYAFFTPATLPGIAPQVTDADLHAYYNANLAKYQTKDQVKVRHILIAVPAGASQQVADAAKAKAANLRQQIVNASVQPFYAFSMSDYVSCYAAAMWIKAECIKEQDSSKTCQGIDALMQIDGQGMQSLIASGKSTTQEREQLFEKEKHSPQSFEQAFRKAGDCSARYRSLIQPAGGDFAALAKANSDDPGSKDQGGELGYIEHGVTVPEFDAAAFSLKPGEISQPIKTQFGYHIIQVEEIKPAHTQTFDEVKDSIKPLVEHQKESEAAQAFAKKVMDQAKSQGLQAAASANGLKVQTTGLITQNSAIPGMTDPAQLLSAAFQAKQNGPPQAAAVGTGYAIFDVKEIQAAHAPAFADFKPTLLNDFRASKVPELLDKKAAELSDRAKVDNNLDKAAKELGATVKSSDLVGQDGQVPDLGAMSSQPQLFSLGTGQISGPITNAAGAFVVQITEKQAPSEQDLNMKFEEARDKLLNQRRDEMFGVFVSDLQKRYENEKRIAYNRQAQQTPGTPSAPGRPS